MCGAMTLKKVYLCLLSETVYCFYISLILILNFIFKNKLILQFVETLRNLCAQFHERLSSLEDQKFDLEYAVTKKDFEARFECLSYTILCQLCRLLGKLKKKKLVFS